MTRSRWLLAVEISNYEQRRCSLHPFASNLDRFRSRRLRSSTSCCDPFLQAFLHATQRSWSRPPQGSFPPNKASEGDGEADGSVAGGARRPA